MSTTLGKRLNILEDRKVLHEFLDERRLFDGRTPEELEFFAVHGYFPETLGSELPARLEGAEVIDTRARAKVVDKELVCRQVKGETCAGPCGSISENVSRCIAVENRKALKVIPNPQ